MFAVEMYAGWPVPIEVTDMGDGTYLVEYTAGDEEDFHGPTSYTISVTLNGDHICGSPFNHTVRARPRDAFSQV